MKNAVIVYGSTTGNTETVANMIASSLDNYDVQVYNVIDVKEEVFENADLILFGVSTWGYGDLQDDFIDYYENGMSGSLAGKNVAVFGCGDKIGFADVFCEATELVRQRSEDFGASIVCDNLKIDGDPADSEELIVQFAGSL